MKQKLLLWVLAAEAVICVLAVGLRAVTAGVFTAALAFPFEQIGLGLRALSLSGSVGNGVALVLYSVLSLAPCLALVLIRKKRSWQSEDGLLLLLSAVLFAILYFMVNPGFLGPLATVTAGRAVSKAMLGVVGYSVLSAYAVLRALRLFAAGSSEQLEGYMEWLLRLLAMLFVYWAFGACAGGLLDAGATLRADNTGNEQLLGLSYVFLILRYGIEALAYVLDVAVIFAALDLLAARRQDRYSVAAAAAAQRVSRLCPLVLAVSVLTQLALNVLQLLFMKELRIVTETLQIPLLSIGFVLAALLLTRLFTENRQLKEENEMFI